MCTYWYISLLIISFLCVDMFTDYQHTVGVFPDSPDQRDENVVQSGDVMWDEIMHLQTECADVKYASIVSLI